LGRGVPHSFKKAIKDKSNFKDLDDKFGDSASRCNSA